MPLCFFDFPAHARPPPPARGRHLGATSQLLSRILLAVIASLALAKLYLVATTSSALPLESTAGLIPFRARRLLLSAVRGQRSPLEDAVTFALTATLENTVFAVGTAVTLLLLGAAAAPAQGTAAVAVGSCAIPPVWIAVSMAEAADPAAGADGAGGSGAAGTRPARGEAPLVARGGWTRPRPSEVAYGAFKALTWFCVSAAACLWGADGSLCPGDPEEDGGDDLLVTLPERPGRAPRRPGAAGGGSAARPAAREARPSAGGGHHGGAASSERSVAVSWTLVRQVRARRAWQQWGVLACCWRWVPDLASSRPSGADEALFAEVRSIVARSAGAAASLVPADVAAGWSGASPVCGVAKSPAAADAAAPALSPPRQSTQARDSGLPSARASGPDASGRSSAMQGHAAGPARSRIDGAHVAQHHGCAAASAAAVGPGAGAKLLEAQPMAWLMLGLAVAVALTASSWPRLYSVAGLVWDITALELAVVTAFTRASNAAAIGALTNRSWIEASLAVGGGFACEALTSTILWAVGLSDAITHL